ncbi:YxiG family protein [Bacillus sp. Marseille-P3800]|uniref:YxiG family protein n=1 Tax=Bacillus sp. Marseille-P3800 TaxID=2014782 RepID=UPI000C07B90A|nr:hypothetical protein [Bacillus sp. Marseille-P3800]
MISSIQEWVNYFDEGCNIIHINFNPFTKEIVLDLEVIEGGVTNKFKVEFQSVASIYYNAGIGDARLNDIRSDEFNWQLFEMAYFPDGIGNLGNDKLDEYHSNANFIIIFNTMLISIEAKRISINSQEICL